MLYWVGSQPLWRHCLASQMVVVEADSFIFLEISLFTYFLMLMRIAHVFWLRGTRFHGHGFGDGGLSVLHMFLGY
jgi:hypothetical protein